MSSEDELCRLETTSWSLVKPKRIIKFHFYNYDLWFYSLFLILADIYLFLLLVHLVAAIVTGLATFWIVLIYWKIHNEW